MHSIIIAIVIAILPLSYSQPEIFHNYENGLSKAKELDKPIFLVFTGKSCKYNNELEWLFENDQQLKEVMQNKYVNIVLYVDDPTPLKNEYEIKRDDKAIKIQTLGDHWANLEITKFNSNLQPLIIIMGSDERLISKPRTFSEVGKSLKYYLIESEIKYKLGIY